MQPPAWLQVERRAVLEGVAPEDGGKLRTYLAGGREFVVDEVIGVTGYRPDLSILSELAIGIDPATEGSAGLARALSKFNRLFIDPRFNAGRPRFRGARILSGEGEELWTARTFLLKSGYAQLETILSRLQSESASS